VECKREEGRPYPISVEDLRLLLVRVLFEEFLIDNIQHQNQREYNLHLVVIMPRHIRLNSARTLGTESRDGEIVHSNLYRRRTTNLSNNSHCGSGRVAPVILLTALLSTLSTFDICFHGMATLPVITPVSSLALPFTGQFTRGSLRQQRADDYVDLSQQERQSLQSYQQGMPDPTVSQGPSYSDPASYAFSSSGGGGPPAPDLENHPQYKDHQPTEAQSVATEAGRDPESRQQRDPFSMGARDESLQHMYEKNRISYSNPYNSPGRPNQFRSVKRAFYDLQQPHPRRSPAQLLRELADFCDQFGITNFDTYGDFDVHPEESYLKRFERELAVTFGKPDAVFIPSGTMAQLIALIIHNKEGKALPVDHKTDLLIHTENSSDAESETDVALSPSVRSTRSEVSPRRSPEPVDPPKRTSPPINRTPPTYSSERKVNDGSKWTGFAWAVNERVGSTSTGNTTGRRKSEPATIEDFDQPPSQPRPQNHHQSTDSTLDDEDEEDLNEEISSKQQRRRRRGSFACHHSSHLLLHEHNAYRELLDMEAVVISTEGLTVEGDETGISVPPMRIEDVERVLLDSEGKLKYADLSTLILELPHREIGGKLTPWEDVLKIQELCQSHGIKMHCDGARIFEASAGYGMTLDTLAKPFDSLFVSFYKGLGSGTAGSMLLGDRDFCDKVRVWLRRFGGNLYTMLPYAVASWHGYQRNWHLVGYALSFGEKKDKMISIIRALSADRDISQIVSFDPALPETNMVHGYIRWHRPDEVHRALNAVELRTGILVLRRVNPVKPGTAAHSWGFLSKFEWTIGEENGTIPVQVFLEGWKELAIELLKRSYPSPRP